MDAIDEIDKKILEAIIDRSPTGWVFSVNVKSALKLEKKVLLDRLIRLKELGYINTQSGSYTEGHLILKNGLNQLQLTDLGRSVQRRK
jgi:DNA-binding Lrp family transcriptional regulator